MLGVAQRQAKGNQNQMGFRLGPSAEATVGPSRSWLLSSGCPGRKECKSGYTGVVRRTVHRCTASGIGRGTVVRHKPRSLTYSERFTEGCRGQLYVLQFLSAFALNEERHLWQNRSSKRRTGMEGGSGKTRVQWVHCASTIGGLEH